MTKQYEFTPQHDRGKAAERFIYETFQDAFNIIPAAPWMQESGIDFTFVDRTTNQVWKVELKTDWTAYRTRNAFIETISNDRESKAGWAYTSQADWLLYFIPQDRRIYRIALEILRVELPSWAQLYRTRAIPNKGRGGDYNTIGLLVPMEWLGRIAHEVIEL